MRTIEEWRERFPKGSTFRESNQSISPVGVLKLNLRNSVIYEHPYSQKELADLYDPVFVDTRIWDMLLAVELQHIQKIIERFETGGLVNTSAENLEELRQIGLRTINEFDGFQLSTSKRTRNLYQLARNAFQIPEMVDLFEKKLSYIDRLLDSSRAFRSQQDDFESVLRQQELMERSNESSEREGASRFLLSVIGIATGLTLALNVVQAFQLGKIWNIILLAGTGLAYALIYVLARVRAKRRPISTRTQRAFHCAGSAVPLVETIASGVTGSIVEATSMSENRGFISFDDVFNGHTVRVRVKLTVGAPSQQQTPNGLMEVEVTTFIRRSESLSLRGVSDFALTRVAQLCKGQVRLSG